MSQRAQNTSPVKIELVASNWILRRDAGLTTEEAAEFECWLAADPLHADAVARKASAWSALDRPLHAGQADWLLERLKTRAARRRRRWVGGAIAGITLICVAATTLVQLPSNSTPAADHQRGVVILPETRRLPDGSVIELRPGAEVDIDFTGALRRVMLKKGEAYFQVARNQNRRFVVTAGTIEVRAVGTAFSVGLGSEQVDVLVTEGSVAVEQPPEQSLSGQAPVSQEYASWQTLATVGAGNRLEVERVAQPINGVRMPIAVSADELSERLAWRAPKLEFSELPLKEAVAMINRYNKVQFMIDDATLADLHISGFFRADNIETFVRLLEATCGIEAQRSDDIIRLRKAGR